MRQSLILVAIGAAVAACGQPVDDAIITEYPIVDYATWGTSAPGARVVVRGTAPGHGNSVRVIYANETAATLGADFRLGYPEGSIIVKEIRSDDGTDTGELQYLAIMRRIGEITTALEDEGGWLFTETDALDIDEVELGFCWARCHAAAPYNGAWYDYRR